MKPTNIQMFRKLVDRGFTVDSLGRWRLPHALYQPSKLELQCIAEMHANKFNDRPLSDEAIAELKKQRERPWTCRIGLHAYGGWVREFGPQTAIQMNMRSGVMVAIYSGEWKTCFICGKQKIKDGIPEN